MLTIVNIFAFQQRRDAYAECTEAERAGYAASGARTEGSRLLTNVDIQQAIATAQTDEGRGGRELIRFDRVEALSLSCTTATPATSQSAQLALGRFWSRMVA